MTLLTTLARLEAAASGRARPLSRVRHRRLAAQPLVIIPLTLAGDPATPVAAMTGTSRDGQQLLVVPQPRNRDLRLGFLAGLAQIVLGYIAARQNTTEVLPATRNREERRRYADAPQVIVPNRAARDYLGLLGRSTRFLPTDGPYAVDPAVPALGKWLTFLADSADQPGSGAARRPHQPPGRALGHRAEPAGRRQPRRPARLDRPAAGHDRAAGRAGHRRSPALPASRARHGPRL